MTWALNPGRATLVERIDGKRTRDWTYTSALNAPVVEINGHGIPEKLWVVGLVSTKDTLQDPDDGSMHSIEWRWER